MGFNNVGSVEAAFLTTLKVAIYKELLGDEENFKTGKCRKGGIKYKGRRSDPSATDEFYNNKFGVTDFHRVYFNYFMPRKVISITQSKTVFEISKNLWYHKVIRIKYISSNK